MGATCRFAVADRGPQSSGTAADNLPDKLEHAGRESAESLPSMKRDHHPIRELPAWLLIILVLSLCGPARAHEPMFIGFAQNTLGNDWHLAQVLAIKLALAEYPQVHFEYTDARGSAALQAKQIEDLVSRGIDLLIVSPGDRTLLTPVIDRVYADGVPVILLSSDIDNDSYTTLVHTGDQAIGRAAGEFLAQRLAGKGRVLMLEGMPGTGTTLYRSRGFIEAVARYPAITVERRTGNDLHADTSHAIEAVLTTGPDIDAIYAQSDSMALTAIMVLRRHGIDPSSLPIVGIDYINESRNAIRRGDLTASFIYPTGGREVASVAMSILSRAPVAREILLESTLVTRDNVDELEPTL